MTCVRLGFRSSARQKKRDFFYTRIGAEEREKSDVSTNWFLIKKTTTSAGWLPALYPTTNVVIYSCCCFCLFCAPLLSIGRRSGALLIQCASYSYTISVGYGRSLIFCNDSIVVVVFFFGSFSRGAPRVKLQMVPHKCSLSLFLFLFFCCSAHDVVVVLLAPFFICSFSASSWLLLHLIQQSHPLYNTILRANPLQTAGTFPYVQPDTVHRRTLCNSWLSFLFFSLSLSDWSL